MFKDILKPEDVMWLTGMITMCLSTLVQTLSKRWKPWTWLAKQIGRACNQEMLDKLDVLDKRMSRLEEHDKEQDARDEEEKAKAARRRILRCADEIRLKTTQHSKEFFDEILSDITYYKTFCNTHREFRNEKAVLAISLVEKTYEQCVKENGFV